MSIKIMKKIILGLILGILLISILVVVQVQAKEKPAPECNYYYWFDNQHNECGYRQFCGAFSYYGLRIFDTKKECRLALGSK